MLAGTDLGHMCDGSAVTGAQAETGCAAGPAAGRMRLLCPGDAGYTPGAV